MKQCIVSNCSNLPNLAELPSSKVRQNTTKAVIYSEFHTLCRKYDLILSVCNMSVKFTSYNADIHNKIVIN